jgi:hypothetical protein
LLRNVQLFKKHVFSLIWFRFVRVRIVTIDIALLDGLNVLLEDVLSMVMVRRDLLREEDFDPPAPEHVCKRVVPCPFSEGKKWA